MSEFTSWLLDGGIVENPEQFAYLGLDLSPFVAARGGAE